MEPLHCLIYVSTSVEALTDDELQALLSQARDNNARLGVTGLLLYSDGNFMQYLEGPRSVLHALFEKISRDARHRQILTIVDEPLERREFGEWAMAHRQVDLPDWLSVSAALLPAAGRNHHSNLQGDPSPARELLIDFWRNCSR